MYIGEETMWRLVTSYLDITYHHQHQKLIIIEQRTLRDLLYANVLASTLLQLWVDLLVQYVFYILPVYTVRPSSSANGNWCKSPTTATEAFPSTRDLAA